MTWHDLSMRISGSTPVFPGDPQPTLEAVASDPGTPSVIHQMNLAFPNHFGTHIDAPYHMLDLGKKLSDYGVDRFVGSAVVIDVRGQKEIRVNAQGLTSAGVKAGDFVFFLTAHSDGAFDPGYFENNPVISLDAAQALIDAGVRLVGLDSFTPDNAPYDVHRRLFQHDVLILENLVNLAPLAGLRIEAIVAPLNLEDADGAPTRVFARTA